LGPPILAFAPPILAFAIAAFLAWLELVTSKYPRTVFLMRRSWALYVYALIYGLIAFGVTLALGSLIKAGMIGLAGIGLSNVWAQAIAVGVSSKALLHIRLFSVSVGSQSFPVGIESIVQLFEPWLLRTIDLDHYNKREEYIAPRAAKRQDLNAVKERMRKDLPTGADLERSAFLVDLQSVDNVVEAMRLYLTFLGKKTFDRVFPLIL
jgi:hypothetical protein